MGQALHLPPFDWEVAAPGLCPHEPFSFRSILLNSARPPHKATLPETWSYDALGLFCKLEVQLERRLPLPVLFRLGGDVRQVDAWEGKRTTSSAP